MRKIHTNYFLLIKKVVTKEIFVHFVIQRVSPSIKDELASMKITKYKK